MFGRQWCIQLCPRYHAEQAPRGKPARPRAGALVACKLVWHLRWAFMALLHTDPCLAVDHQQPAGLRCAEGVSVASVCLAGLQTATIKEVTKRSLPKLVPSRGTPLSATRGVVSVKFWNLSVALTAWWRGGGLRIFTFTLCPFGGVPTAKTSRARKPSPSRMLLSFRAGSPAEPEPLRRWAKPPDEPLHWRCRPTDPTRAVSARSAGSSEPWRRLHPP